MSDAAPKLFRAGDTVTHGPSGETWTLACDQEGEWVMPAGWPESLAKASDCTLLEQASDVDRLEMLRLAAAHSGSSYRSSRARCQLSLERP